MPFTPSHAVVALPFVRTPLVPAAIAIGAMTPDLPLFLRGFGLNYAFLHGFANVVWTALLAFVLFLVWRVVLRPASLDLAPGWLARRLPSEWSEGGVSAAGRAVGRGERRGFPVLLAVSLVLGVLSHIAWDLFTHEGRWGVDLVPALAQAWGPLPGYKWLQHGSSVIGLAILGIWAVLRLRRTAPRIGFASRTPVAVRLSWWLSLPVLLAGAWVCGLAALGPLTADFTVAHLAYRVLPPACALWAAITLVLCPVLAMRRPHQAG
ncbi:DUF4184 family protein [Microbacterium sp. 179-I 3D4 NHS]|uniref:DUF4184 family protein n=1 Tax=Microbacterium sp. 179-I 3D4 NHS TaxID=3142381 RepID=UPI0039A1091E